MKREISQSFVKYKNILLELQNSHAQSSNEQFNSPNTIHILKSIGN
jgi:hypothetical protein